MEHILLSKQLEIQASLKDSSSRESDKNEANAKS